MIPAIVSRLQRAGMALLTAVLLCTAVACSTPPPPPPTADLAVRSPLPLTVGDIITFTVTITHPTGTRLHPPTEPPAWPPLEMRPPAAVQTTDRDSDDQTVTVWPLRATAWQPGVYRTRPFTLALAGDGFPTATVSLPATAVTITALLTDTAPTLRDLKPQADLPSEADPVPWLLMAAALFSSGGMWGWWWMAYRRPPVSARSRPAPIPRTPLQIARDRLRRLHGRLRDAGTAVDVRAAYEELDDILRGTAVAHWRLSHMRPTTAELAAALPHTDNTAVLLALLQATDLVKFAGLTPTRAEAVAAVRWAQAWLNRQYPSKP